MASAVNYLSHAYQYLDNPYFIAGTALPDWMSVVDRKNRARSQRAELVLDHADARVASLAQGVVQHHFDDKWFHQTECFVRLSTSFAVEVRGKLAEGAGHQAGFLSHIVVELLLDSVLIEDQPNYLADYYSALSQLDVQVVQQAANLICTKSFDALPKLIPRFIQEQFLADYQLDEKLHWRLNHVMRRVGLPDLPPAIIDWLAHARKRVRAEATELLQPSKSEQI